MRDGVIADAPRPSNLGDIPSSPIAFPSSSNCNCFSTKFKLTGGMVNCLFGANLEDIRWNWKKFTKDAWLCLQME